MLRSFVTVAFFALAGGPAVARADAATDLSLARERFTTARKLEDAGRWAEALTLLQRVAEVKMTPQVRFHIALCMENVGLWTQALDGYALAASEAGASAPEVVKEANEHQRKLEASVPTITMHIEGAAHGDHVTIDRRRVSADERTPIRVDPGAHTAEVRRDGSVVAREIFVLEPKGGTRRIDVRVGSVAPGVEAPLEGTATSGSAQRIAGWSVLGVGAASAVAAGVFIGLRAGALSRLKDQCPTFPQCGAAVAPIVTEGKVDAALVNVFGVLGGAAVVTGVTLLLTAPTTTARPAKATTARIDVMPAVSGDTFGIVAGGVF
ncbi:Hypothetical protein A7982_05483 [Minicystis rosea]|nr:Hypothetical protein A7982_05483 [Minicystis rosea]